MQNNLATELKDRIEFIAMNLKEAYEELAEVYKIMAKIEEKIDAP